MSLTPTGHSAVLGVAQLGNLMLGSGPLIRPAANAGAGQVNPAGNSGQVAKG